uniref:Uncharacterized protein n=1 Tax=Glossina palpalis gambiensis TaxID=67801 RepID=A0A1B0AX71_9MUSC
MVEIQKPSSALKRPSLKRETVVVNNSAPMKKVTLVPKDETQLGTRFKNEEMIIITEGMINFIKVQIKKSVFTTNLFHAAQ